MNNICTYKYGATGGIIKSAKCAERVIPGTQYCPTHFALLAGESLMLQMAYKRCLYISNGQRCVKAVADYETFCYHHENVVRYHGNNHQPTKEKEIVIKRQRRRIEI